MGSADPRAVLSHIKLAPATRIETLIGMPPFIEYMKEYSCPECFWKGKIETTQEADKNRRAVETTDVEHCPVCGKWGI